MYWRRADEMLEATVGCAGHYARAPERSGATCIASWRHSRPDVVPKHPTFYPASRWHVGEGLTERPTARSGTSLMLFAIKPTG